MRLVLQMRIRCSSLSITTQVSLLANEIGCLKCIAGASVLGSCQSY